MVDLYWKTKMVSSDAVVVPNKSPRPLSNKLQISIPILPPVTVRVDDFSPASDSACSAYEHYLRLPELKKLWSCQDFPAWRNEAILKPALHGLEITFRFISTVLSDPRPYVNRREWSRRLESLATAQVEIIALLCQAGGEEGTVPIVDLTSNSGVVPRQDSSSEVWKLAGDTTVVSRTSEGSLLPRLATWRKSEDIAEKILCSIECEMRGCPYTMGLGEPNLRGKPNLDYDRVCKPAELHDSFKKCPLDHHINLPENSYENQTIYLIHQILESWIHTSEQLLKRISDEIEQKEFENASSNCWQVEKIWKLLMQIEDLHSLMDPDDFLRLKEQLCIKTTSENDMFCFRSRGLIRITKLSKDLRNRVPCILEAEVDPNGGPRIQEAAMELYRRKRNSNSNGNERIHLLQGLQAVEMAMKRFYYSYKQLLVMVMGSLEGNKGNKGWVWVDSGDKLAQIFLEPTYFPSLDAAKTFLGEEYWSHERRRRCLT